MEPTKTNIQEIVLDPTPIEASIAARPAVDQIELRRRAHNFLETVLAEPSFPEAGLVVGSGPTHKLDSSELLKRISETGERLLLAVELIQAINKAGEPSPDRGTALEEELFYPAIETILIKRKRQQPLNPGEITLLAATHKSLMKELSSPIWYAAARKLFDLVGRPENLPGPEVYLQHSASASDSSAPMRKRLTEVNSKIANAKSTSPEGDDKASSLQSLNVERSRLRQELDQRLAQAEDVDPSKIGECLEALRVRVCPEKQLIEGLINLRHGLAGIIAKLCKVQDQRLDFTTIDLLELIDNEASAGAADLVRKHAYQRFDFSEIGESETAKLPKILEIFEKVHNALVACAKLISEPTERPDSERNVLQRTVLEHLQAPFLGDFQLSQNILTALARKGDRAIEAMLVRLITLESAAFHGQKDLVLKPFIVSENNFALLELVIKTLLDSSERQRSQLTEKLARMPELSSLLALCSKIRSAKDAGKWTEVRRELDRNLKTLSDANSKVDFYAAAALMHILNVLAEDPATLRKLKGRLINFELLADLAKKFSDSRGQNSVEVGSQRAKIYKKYQPDLDNYWGQTETVKKVKTIISEYLELLANPDSWEGQKPSSVFLNGLLFYGLPGVGKTYLARCAATHFNLHLVVITREAMDAAISKKVEVAQGSGKPKKEDEQLKATFELFVKDKIEEEQKEMEKNGAAALMFFFDELEAEFLKRDPQTSSREDLSRTNIMLRVIEDLMIKYPQIIFCGASNHIAMVDEAARRIGRFGLLLPLTLTKEEDAKQILDGVFDDLGIDVEPKMLQTEEFKNLVKECTNTTPLTIQIALNNTSALVKSRTQQPINLDQQFLKALAEKVSLLKQLSSVPNQSDLKA